MRYVTLLALLLAACRAPSSAEIRVDQVEGYRRGYHRGPEVFFAPGAGTDRFAAAVLEELDADAAAGTVHVVDAWYREAGNEGYDAALDNVLAGLREAGYGEDDGFELRVDERPLGHPAWTPRRARLELRVDDMVFVLHHFGPEDDRDRCMLPVHAPAADARGPVALSLEELDPGEVLVTDAPLRAVLDAARERDAAAVLSSHLRDFNVDPSGELQHEQAIPYGEVPVGTRLPVAHVSPAAHARVRRAAKGGDAELRLVAEVGQAEGRLRTVIATATGEERPGEVVALVAHAQEPGAGDNATGIAGLLEGARALRRAIEAGTVARPRRSVAFVWGDEYRASRVFLETTERRPVAGISADMIGASKARTGAICLLERGPDPGALTPLPPDEHTPWGAGEVRPAWLFPNGLAVILRCALVDVGVAAGGWETSEHPWEGGSDHDVFLAAGIPGALVWHFTDFTYHTSLDRPERVDPAELHRTTAALLVGALGVADARPGDLRRYVESARAEAEARAGAAELEGAPVQVAEQWVEWYGGARRWLAALCAGETPPDRFE